MIGDTSVAVVGSGVFYSSTALTKLEDELANATKRREEAEAALSNAESSYADALSQKQAIDNKIYALDVEIEALVSLIDEINAQIDEKNEQINAENEKLTNHYNTVRARIRVKHEEGGFDLISVVLDSESLTDFFAGIDRYVSMLDYDNRLLSTYNNGIAELERLREELEISKRTLNMQMLNLEVRREELSNSLVKASKLVASTENQIATAEDDLKKVAAEELQFSNKREELLVSIEMSTHEKEVEGEYIWPLSSQYKKVSSGFGWRIHPVTGKNQHHNGIDIPAPYGTDVWAVNDGTVIECSYNYADGYFITVSHGGGVASFYSHLSRQRVAVGDKVKRGQVIGNVGTSGYTTGAHLNLNMYENNVAVNPNKFFSW